MLHLERQDYEATCERKVTFDEEAAASNMTTIERINLHVGLLIIILNFWSFQSIQILSSAYLSQTLIQLEGNNQSYVRGTKLRDNEKKVESDEGQVLVNHKKSKKKRGSLLVQTLTKSRIVKMHTKKTIFGKGEKKLNRRMTKK